MLRQEVRELNMAYLTILRWHHNAFDFFHTWVIRRARAVQEPAYMDSQISRHYELPK